MALTQSSPSCPHAGKTAVEGQESTGRQHRTLWGGPGQERPPLSRVEWCQSGSSDRAEGGQLVLGWGRAHSQPSLQEGGPSWGTLGRGLGSQLGAQILPLSSLGV